MLWRTIKVQCTNKLTALMHVSFLDFKIIYIELISLTWNFYKQIDTEIYHSINKFSPLWVLHFDNISQLIPDCYNIHNHLPTSYYSHVHAHTHARARTHTHKLYLSTSLTNTHTRIMSKVLTHIYTYTQPITPTTHICADAGMHIHPWNIQSFGYVRYYYSQYLIYRQNTLSNV